jgi:hypothetical protein
MEEASSLAKAFAQAWEHAGKPQECTVKVLAEPEKNFLGLTTKSAKIALFFNEAPAHSFGAKKPMPQPQATQQQPRRNTPKQAQEAAPQRQPQQRRQPQERTPRVERTQEPRAERVQEARPVERKQHITQVVDQQLELIPTTPKNEQTPRVRPTWTDEMNTSAQTWIKESLTIMGCDASFETAMARSTLTVTFNKPLIEDVEKERLLFRSWAHLIVQHVKQNFKVHGKELKIILKGSRA